MESRQAGTRHSVHAAAAASQQQHSSSRHTLEQPLRRGLEPGWCQLGAVGAAAAPGQCEGESVQDLSGQDLKRRG